MVGPVCVGSIAVWDAGKEVTGGSAKEAGGGRHLGLRIRSIPIVQ